MHTHGRTPRILVCLGLLAPALACDDGGSEAAGDITFTVRFVDAVAPDSGPLVGVEVCVAERPDLACETTDRDGRVVITVPADSDILLRCHGASHGPAYMTLHTDTNDMDVGVFQLLEEDFQAAFVQLAGGTIWPATGAITANVYESIVDRTTRVADVTFTITPSGGGPTYAGASRLPDRSLTASTTGGPAIFYDRADGEAVAITIAHPTRACVGGFGWPGGDAKTLRTKVFAGAITNVTFICPP